MALCRSDMSWPMLLPRKAAEVFTSLRPCADPQLVPALVGPVHLINDLGDGDVGESVSACTFKDRIQSAEAVASHNNPPMGSFMAKTVAEEKASVPPLGPFVENPFGAPDLRLGLSRNITGAADLGIVHHGFLHHLSVSIVSILNQRAILKDDCNFS